MVLSPPSFYDFKDPLMISLKNSISGFSKLLKYLFIKKPGKEGSVF